MRLTGIPAEHRGTLRSNWAVRGRELLLTDIAYLSMEGFVGAESPMAAKVLLLPAP